MGWRSDTQAELPEPDIETEYFAIFDDFLGEDEWTELWQYFQHENLKPIDPTAGAWTLNDGQAYLGPDIHTPNHDASELPPGLARYPSQTAMDPIFTQLLSMAPALKPWVGERETWQRLTGRAYVYPQGSSLGWHCDDHQLYSGAFVFYAHPEWNIDWGGELMIASTDPETELPPKPMRFDNFDYQEAIMHHGLGHIIFPRPNRLVVLSGAPHRVAPIGTAAGSAIRASVAGFFLR